MTHSVRVLARAQRDVQACFAYIAERSPQGAASWFNRFSETRDRLAQDPQSRAIAPENEHVAYEVHEVLCRTRKGEPYRILFTILDDEVLVLCVRGPGQDYLSEDQLPDKPQAE